MQNWVSQNAACGNIYELLFGRCSQFSFFRYKLIPKVLSRWQNRSTHFRCKYNGVTSKDRREMEGVIASSLEKKSKRLTQSYREPKRKLRIPVCNLELTCQSFSNCFVVHGSASTKQSKCDTIGVVVARNTPQILMPTSLEPFDDRGNGEHIRQFEWMRLLMTSLLVVL